MYNYIKNKPNQWFICILLFFIFFNTPTDATHFRYGSLTWSSTSDPYTYSFSLKVAFRYTYFTQNGYGTPEVGKTLSYGKVTFSYQNVCWYCTKSDSMTTNFLVNHVDLANDWLTAEWLFTASFRQLYDMSVYYNNGDRLSTLLNNADGKWNVATYISMSNSNGGSSPVSGLLPVVSAYMGQANNWRIPAIDSQTNSFTFSLASYNEMPGYQPSGMSITSDGMVTYTPTQIGIWCSQVKIQKTLPTYSTYIVVDYMINVTKAPPPQEPPFFVMPPTPKVNEIVPAPANMLKSITIVGQSPQTTSSVAISLGNLPEGMKTSAQTNNKNVGTMILSWTPTTSQIGVYVISMGLVDSQGIGLKDGIQSFYIQVEMPSCGNGNITPNGCVCKEGWAGEKCNECAPGYYGPNCIKLPPCDHGTSNGGTLGDGSCICEPGWIGDACNTSLIQRCSTNQASYVITKTNVQGQNIQPSSAQVYLTNYIASPAVLTSKLTAPPTSIPLDIYFVLDVSSSSSSQSTYNQFQSLYSDFENNLPTLARENSNIGIGYFSDSVNQPNSFQLVSVLKQTIKTEVKSLSMTVGSPQANIQYKALIQAASTVQWTASGTVKMMILVTDNDLAPTDSTLIPSLQTTLSNNNILLGVFCLNSVNSYNWITPQIGMAKPWSSSSLWYKQLVSNVINPMGTTVQTTVSGQTEVISSGPTQLASGDFQTSFKYPTNGMTVKVPVVSINYVGFASQTIQIQYNHQPSTTSPTITLLENAPATPFSIQGSDIDNNVLTIKFTELPTKGALTINGGAVQLNTEYSFPNPQTNAFTYTPSQYKNGNDYAKYEISDGCLSVNGVVTLSITPVNNAPVCTSKTLTTDQFNKVNFAIDNIDYDDDVVTLSFSGLSSISSIGSITLSGQTSSITQNTQYPSNSNFVFTPVSTALNSTVVVPVIVTDTSGLSSQCQLTVVLQRVNVPPTLDINTQYTIAPEASLTIPYSITDPDPSETLTVQITAVTPVSGTFYDVSNNQITSAPYLLATFTKSSASSLSYKAINANETGISFTIKVTDRFGASVSKVVNIVVNGQRVNRPPVALPVATLTFNQDLNSTTFTLDGTDADRPRYDNQLTTIISSSPQFGRLFNSNGTPLSSSNLVAPLSIFYSPNQGFFGSDSMVFYLQDSMNAQSNMVTVKFVVNFVNHDPYVNAPNLAVFGQTDGGSVNQKFSVSASDIDKGDSVTIKLTSLPQFGSISYASGGSALTQNTVLTSTNLLYSVPETINKDFVTSYTIQGCDTHGSCINAVGKISFNFTVINYPPNCTQTIVNTDQLTPVNFVLNAYDRDSAVVKVSMSGLKSMSNMGSITKQNTVVNDGDLFVVPATFTFTPLSTSSGMVTIPLTVVDELNLSSQCSLVLNVTRVYVPPTLSIAQQITVSPDTVRSIPFSITDYGFNTKLNVNITSITPVGGSFLDGSNKVISSTPYSLGSFDVTNSARTASSSLSYQSINGIYSGVQFTIVVFDDKNGKDTKTVTINVDGDITPYPPVATPAGPISVPQNDISSPVTLTGAHPKQPLYTGKLYVFISKKPASGTVLDSNGNDLTGSLVAPFSVTYKPNTNYKGSDEFEFYVQDDKGLVSVAQKVQVTVTKVDYPPVIEINPTSITTSTVCETKPSPSSISISVKNINEMNNLQVSITQRPSTGSLLYNGQPVTSVPLTINTNLPLQYLADNSIYSSYDATYEIKACDQLCSTATGKINVQYIASTPIGKSNTFETIQNKEVPFTLVGSDCQDGTKVKYQFQLLPSSGSIRTSNGVQVNSTSEVFDSNDFIYTPFLDESDIDTVSGLGPLESISYLVINTNAVRSTVYPISIFVRPIPTYHGERNMTTLENTELTIPIKASAPDGKPFSLNVKSFTGHGKLYYMSSATSSKVEIPATGATLNEPSYTLFYIPPLDVYGTNIDSLNFNLNQTYSSEIYTIYIDVTHIFRPPVIIPLTYTKNGTELPIVNAIAETLVNHSTILTFNVTSRDFDPSTLVSAIGPGLTSTGSIYQYNESIEGGAGERLTLNSVVKRSNDGLWRIVFVPAQGRSGLKLFQFLIVATDPIKLSSSNRLFMSVLRTNIPPVVNIQQFNYNFTVSNSITVQNVSVFDPDSTERNNITFTLTLADSNDKPTEFGSIAIPFATPTSCNITNNTVTCIDRNDVLNLFLNTLSISISKQGNYKLIVYVNDLGYNAINPSENMMSDTKSIQVRVFPSSSGTNTSKVVMSAAIAGAAVGAAVVALGVWRLLRSRMPPTDAFFGDAPFAEGGVASNPLYESHAGSQINPIYEAEDV